MSDNIKYALLGLIIGFTNGIFGAGGGMILILILEKMFSVEEKKSHATATAVILPLCIVSAFIMIKNYKFDWSMVLLISIGGIVGGFIGAKFLNKVSNTNLRKIFGFFIILAGVKMIL
jgi:Predicted permeases